MPLFPLGNLVNPDFLMDAVNDGLILGDISGSPRPKMPTGAKATHTPLKPPIGFQAIVDTPLEQLLLLEGKVDDGDGSTVTLSVPNTIAPIFYTLDGSEPVYNGETATNHRYIAPFDVKFPAYVRGTDVTVKAKAFSLDDDRWANSPTVEIVVSIPL